MLKRLLLVAFLCFSAAAQAQVKVGETVPSFDTRLLDGKTLSAQALKGKAVLVVYWATWCPPCQRELPELQSLYEKYRDKGFEILALSIDADKFTVEEFWKDHDYQFSVAMIAPAHTQALGKVKATPTLHLIDREGKLNLVRLGPMGKEKLEARLLPLLRN
ncbi:MAG: redoxin family protein [Rhodocyclaceae bacterium]|nr:redoxin family protein [Rhodocyclaceae bacterium]